MPLVAVQTLVTPQDIPVTNSVFLVFQQFGPMVFIPVAEGLFLNKLLAVMESIYTDLTETEIVQAGATGLRLWVTENQLESVVVGYARSLRVVFILAAA